VARSTIGQVEAGLQKRLSVDNLVKLAKALNVTLDQLVQSNVLEEPEGELTGAPV
jgi:transcriptional regulator with XRE-family HTH domain